MNIGCLIFGHWIESEYISDYNNNKKLRCIRCGK